MDISDMAPDNKRRLSSDGSTPKPSDKTAKPASNGNNGNGESTERNVFSNASPPAHSNTAQPAWVDQLMTKINDLDVKISKIDKVSEDLSSLCNKIESIQNRVSHLEKFTGNMGNTIGDIRKAQNDIKSSVKDTGKEIQEMRRVNEQLQDQITDLQARSMRDNLLFFGLAEFRGHGRENCVNIINDFCETEMGIPDIRENIERAHRLGKFVVNKTRPIVVKFSNFRVRENIRTNAFRIKNRNFSVREQFPREIVQKRKALIPVMKRALRDNRRAVMKVDKLYIDGRLYVPPDVDDSESEGEDEEDNQPIEENMDTQTDVVNESGENA